MRKGRFDEIFFVDLPDVNVRQQILSIHLKKRQLDEKTFNLPRVAELAEGFSGAELEQVVVSALYSLDDSETMNDNHLIQAVVGTTPLSVVMAEQLAALRHWADGRTVPA